MKPFPPRLAFAALVLIVGCATPVHTEVKPAAPFASYRTFALLPLPQSGPASEPGLMLRLAKPAQEAVAAALLAKGYQPAEREKADFVVNLRGSSLPKVEVTDWGYSRTAHTRYGSLPVHVGEVDVSTYEERTLTVEVFENRSKELVWVGWTKRKATGQVKVQKVQDAIRNILAKFPQASP